MGDEDKSDKLAATEAEMQRLGVQAAFRKAAEQVGFFGRSQIFVEVGASDDPVELLTPLVESPVKIGQNALRGLRVIEPLWTYPGTYNSTNRLAADFYRPQSWIVMNREVHASRLMAFVSRPLPDPLKPA
ncbi:anti-CBASS protein Acb1 family protein [Trinickia violacea]|uniref:anti-CBASS protein Acb1 family protein n=1 Tax=Trinickia violacea TaxID=2571746 RepID=UPI001586D95D|nr:anti-CBASS Acb1 family protein [Trinickia violacea]